MADLKLPFSVFLALRYLKPKRTFLSIITLISVLGVMLGVTVLILVISVMTGFDRELRQKVIDLDRKSTRLNSSHLVISYAVFCLKKKKNKMINNLLSIYDYRLC